MKMIIQNDNGEIIGEIGEKQVGKPLEEITEQVLYILDDFIPISDELYEKLNHFCD
jgi:hypothetical protein